MKKKERSKEAEDATEEEVEEFFAILRRMKEAMKYLQKSTAGGCRAAVESESEAEASVAVAEEDEDRREVKGEVSRGSQLPVVMAEEEEEEETGCINLDLNVAPVEESTQVG